MRFEQIDFNEDLIKGKDLVDFINHKSYQHLWPKLTDKQRSERLKELHGLVNPKKITDGYSRKSFSKSKQSGSELSDSTVTN